MKERYFWTFFIVVIGFVNYYFECSFCVKELFKTMERQVTNSIFSSSCSHSFIMSYSYQDDDEEFVLADEDSDEGESLPDQSYREKQVPKRGLYDHTKDFLIQQLELRGGPHACTKANKLLESICDENKDILGEPCSELRSRVQVCVYHWKKKPTIYCNAKLKAKKREQQGAVEQPSKATPTQPSSPTSPPKVYKTPGARISTMFSPSRKKHNSKSTKLFPSLCFDFSSHHSLLLGHQSTATAILL